MVHSAISAHESVFVAVSPFEYLVAPVSSIDVEQAKIHYAGKGNMINYAATVIDGVQRGESLDSIRQEVLKNVHAAVIEHPVADSIGEYTYANVWKLTPQGLRLKGDIDYLDDIIKRGITDKTGQVPQFEALRNEQDGAFLEKLTALRRSGYVDEVIKFSPSPELINDPDVRARGYTGNDQISVFLCDQRTFQEQVHTFWFPAASLGEYRQLFSQLSENQSIFPYGINPPIHVSDVSIMGASGRPTREQLAQISDFVSSRRTLVLERAAEIQRYCDTVLLPKIEEEMMPIIEAIANAIMNSEDDASISNRLGQAFGLLSDLQFELRLYIRDCVGLDTFSREISAQGVSFDQFTAAEGFARSEIVKSLGYEASGCGFDGSDSGALKASLGFLWGITSIFSLGGLSELYTFICPQCHAVHAIDVPNGVFIDFCSCGFDARC